MDANALREEMRQVVERYGDWTDHNIHITGDLYTIGADVVSTRLRRIVQIVADTCGEPFTNLRVLDLACLEGLYAIEFARQGARAVAIEGREASIEKVRFVQKALGLDNLTLSQDDVRNLCREKYGEFDVVLCLGILYHLDAPDVFRFVENISRVTTRLAVFDTFVSLASKEVRVHEGRSYWGREIFEHFPSDSVEQRLDRVWASLDNPKSFWLTELSLYNLLSACGFTTVYKCQVPADVHKPLDRVTLLAIKGTSSRLSSVWARPKRARMYGRVSRIYQKFPVSGNTRRTRAPAGASAAPCWPSAGKGTRQAPGTCCGKRSRSTLLWPGTFSTRT